MEAGLREGVRHDSFLDPSYFTFSVPVLLEDALAQTCERGRLRDNTWLAEPSRVRQRVIFVLFTHLEIVHGFAPPAVLEHRMVPVSVSDWSSFPLPQLLIHLQKHCVDVNVAERVGPMSPEKLQS